MKMGSGVAGAIVGGASGIGDAVTEGEGVGGWAPAG